VGGLRAAPFFSILERVVSKEYLQRRRARLARKGAKRKLKAKAARIAKQLAKHEEAKERRKRMRLFREVRKNRAAGGK
jgi:hypothetical protein